MFPLSLPLHVECDVFDASIECSYTHKYKLMIKLYHLMCHQLHLSHGVNVNTSLVSVYDTFSYTHVSKLFCSISYEITPERTFLFILCVTAIYCRLYRHRSNNSHVTSTFTLQRVLLVKMEKKKLKYLNMLRWLIHQHVFHLILHPLSSSFSPIQTQGLFFLIQSVFYFRFYFHQ